MIHQLFHDKGLFHIETTPLICRANQWTGVYMIGTSVVKELTEKPLKNTPEKFATPANPDLYTA